MVVPELERFGVARPTLVSSARLLSLDKYRYPYFFCPAAQPSPPPSCRHRGRWWPRV